MVAIKAVTELPAGGRKPSLEYQEILDACAKKPDVWHEVSLPDRTPTQLGSIAQHLRKTYPQLEVTQRKGALYVLAHKPAAQKA
jgi:hypothetical protein